MIFAINHESVLDLATDSIAVGQGAGLGLVGKTPAQLRTICSLYTIAQTDSAISVAVAALVDSSPATLDTLNELAAALGDDAAFSTTIVASIATKVASTRTITAGTGLSGGGDLSANRTISLANTAVTPGAYTATNLTVDAQGRITSAATGSGGMAIGGSITGATAGSVLFAGVAGVLDQDNANLSWNKANATLEVNGLILLGGDIPATPLQCRHMDMFPNITTDGDIYGGLFRPTRSAGTAGEVIGVEGYLSGTPHTANNRRNMAVVGDCRSEKGAFTGSINVAVWGIATAADRNVSIYGSIGQAIFNDWVGIGLNNDGSVLKPVPVLASFPLHVRDKRTLTANESTSFSSNLLLKQTDGASLYSVNGPVLSLRKTITNVTADTGPYLMADDGFTIFFTVSTAGAVTALSTITATNGLRATAGGLTVTAGNIDFVAGDLFIHNPKKIYFDAGYTVSIGATGNTGTNKDMQFFAGGGGAGTERMRIMSTGNVGIGDTSPDAQLDVKANAADQIGLIVQGAASRTVPVMQLQTSAEASLGNVGGVIFNSFTDTATTSVDGTENDLYSYNTAANTLVINGDTIEQREHVQFVASATAARRIRKYFSGTLIFDSTALTLTLGGDFWLETTIIRESATEVRCSVSVVTTSAATLPYAKYTRITGLTLNGTNILKTTGTASGTGAAVGDIVNKVSKVLAMPAA